MNFRIVEGDYSVLSPDEFECFRREYLESDLNCHDLRLKYGLSKKQYTDLRQVICKEEGITRRNLGSPKYYKKLGGRWYIQKSVKNKTMVLCSFKCSDFSEDEIKEIVKECKSLKWDYNLCKELFKVKT